MTRAVLALVFVAACSQAPRDDDQPWIASVAERHRAADELLDRGDAAGAQQALRSAVEAVPATRGTTDDGRRVLQDTYYRLARLDLDGRSPGAALADVDRGLALGRARDLFVANLLVARGAAHEALGDAAAASADYHQALLINEELLGEIDGVRGGRP